MKAVYFDALHVEYNVLYSLVNEKLFEKFSPTENLENLSLDAI